MNNKTKTRIYASILCFFCLPIFSGYVSGQENSLFPEGEHMDSTALLATVNGRDISLESGADGKFTLSFGIENREMVQPEVRYGIVLKKIEGGKEIEVERKIFEEVVTLPENQKIAKKVEYQVPYFSRGLHEIILEIRTSDGLLLDYARAGQINLNGNGQNIEIAPERSSLINQTKNSEALFQEGIVYEEKDNLLIKCRITNKFDIEKRAVPAIILRDNSSYGRILARHEYPSENLGPGEEKDVELKIPSFKAEKNRATDLSLFFQEGGQPISVSFQTNLFPLSRSGESAWILNVRFNKIGYVSGDTAEIRINWDGFSAYEDGRKAPIGEIPVWIKLVSRSGASCVGNVQKSVSKLTREIGQYESEIKLAIERDCPDFIFSLALLGSDNSPLAKGEYEIFAPGTRADILDKAKEEISKHWKKIIIFFAIVNCLIIFWFAYKWIRKRIAYKNYIIPIVPLIFAIFTGMPGESRADTYYEPENRMIYNLSTGRESYFTNHPDDQKYKIRSSIQRGQFQNGFPWTPGFHISLQVKAPGIITRDGEESGWKTILENALLSYSQVAGGAEIEFKTPRIQEYDLNSGPWLKSLINGIPVSRGNPLARLELNLREDGVCGKKEYINESPVRSEACLYGTPGFSDDQSKFEYADAQGKIRWKCLNIEGEKDADCEGSIKLDAQCGRANGKAICNLEKYASSAQSLYSDYALYCDNRGWVIGGQSNLETWGKVPENFSAGMEEKKESWICRGVGGGAEAGCRIIPGKKAACGPASGRLSKEMPNGGLCASGSPSGVTRIQDPESGKNGEKGQKWKWTCDFSEANISFGCAVDCTAPVLIEKPEEKPEEAKTKE